MNSNEEKLTSTDKEIDAVSLAEELYPLMKDYFVGEFSREGNAITCVFGKEQRFKIIIDKTD